MVVVKGAGDQDVMDGCVNPAKGAGRVQRVGE